MADGSEKKPAAPAIERGTVVDFKFHDPITGRTLDGFGVVLRAGSDSEAAVIAPCSPSYLHVATTDLDPITF